MDEAASNQHDELDWSVRLFVYQFLVEHERPPTIDETARRWESPSSRRVRRMSVCIAVTRSSWSRERSTYAWRIHSPRVRRRSSVHVGTHAYYANCAWDMLGIPAALHADARIEAVYADTGEPAQFGVTDGHVHGRGVVSFALPFRQWYDDLIFT